MEVERVKVKANLGGLCSSCMAGALLGVVIVVAVVLLITGVL